MIAKLRKEWGRMQFKLLLWKLARIRKPNLVKVGEIYKLIIFTRNYLNVFNILFVRFALNAFLCLIMNEVETINVIKVATHI